MAADQIDGQDRDKSQKQGVNDNGRWAWIKADDKSKSGNEFQKGDDDSNQVDEHFRKKVISVNDFSKIRGGNDFVETGIDKGKAQNPAHRQFDPAVVFYGLSHLIQSDALPLPSPEVRR